jgi:hypothetical protein
VRLRRAWPMKRVASAVLYSIVPFGPFMLDPSLKREQEQEQDSQEDAAAVAA